MFDYYLFLMLNLNSENCDLNIKLKPRHELDRVCLCVIAFMLNGLHECCYLSWKQVDMHINETRC